MKVLYQNILVDEQWSRSGELVFTSTHVNMSLSVAPDPVRSYEQDNTMLIVDFLPIENRHALRAEALSESAIVAMYMNNRAA